MRKQKVQPTNRRLINRSKPKARPFSYYSSRSTADATPARSKKELKHGLRWQLIPSFLAVAAILASLVYSSVLDTNPRLKIEKTASSGLLQDQSVYESAIQQRLRESIFSRSKLLIDTKSIESKILADFPELKAVGITIPLTSRRPIVAIKAVEPRLILTMPENSYIIDSNGRAALRQADPSAWQGMNLPLVQDETGLRPELGKVTLTGREAAFVSELAHQLREKKLNPESIILPALANELHVRLTGQPYFVKFNMLADARLQVGTYIATRLRLEKDGVTPSEYIDVRTDEKAFYK